MQAARLQTACLNEARNQMAQGVLVGVVGADLVGSRAALAGKFEARQPVVLLRRCLRTQHNALVVLDQRLLRVLRAAAAC